jgi:FkbM family methyltransferase
LLCDRLQAMLKKTHNSVRQRMARAISTLDHFQIRCRELWVRQIIRRPIWFTDKHGVTCQLYPDDQLDVYFGMKSHFDDENTLALTKQLLRPGMTVFDVGAHWGAFSLFAAQFVRPNGVIHAFEPTLYSYERLNENVSHTQQWSKIILNHAAVCCHEGEVVLNEFPPQFSAWNTLGRPKMALSDGQVLQPTHSEVVKAVTLDTYCQELQIQRIDLLKIDVEGFEAEVIEGCSELLRHSRINKIIFEISLAPLAGADRSAREILEAFTSYGLRISRIGNNGELTRVANVDSYEAPFFANYLAEPTDFRKAR